MKTIILSSSPYFRALIIAGVIFSSMAFRNPFVVQNENQNIQLMDTIPNAEINVNIDVNKILAEVDKAMASINFEKIMTDVQQSLQKIDFEKMQKDIDASLKNIDWKMVNRNIDSAMKNIDYKKMKIDIEKNMD